MIGGDSLNKELIEKELMQDLEPQQAEAIKALYNRINGKKTNEILPIVMAFKMPKGKPISEEKRNKLIALVMEQINGK